MHVRSNASETGMFSRTGASDGAVGARVFRRVDDGRVKQVRCVFDASATNETVPSVNSVSAARRRRQRSVSTTDQRSLDRRR